MSHAEALLVVDGLIVRYDGFMLHPVHLSVAPGERVALVGPNGAGKSTLLKAVLGRIPDHEGEIRVEGLPIRENVVRTRQRVGLLPETLLGYGWMPVNEHLDFLSRFQPNWDAQYAVQLLERLGIPTHTRIAALSRGQQVKLMFVAAEAFRPPLLLLDEPTSGLDPVVRNELLHTIDESLSANPGRSVIFSTHILEDVAALADRIVILVDGRLRMDIGKEELRKQNDGRPLTEILYQEFAPTC